MSFTYRGTTSDSMFFNVTERQVYNAPAFDVNAIEVPGRSGDVLNSQQRFKNKTLVYTGFIRSSDFPGNTQWERLSRGLRNIKAWICGDAGKYHDLTDDYDPGFIRRAFVSGETAINILFDRPDGATIAITFMAEPFMYEVSEPMELPETKSASGDIITITDGVENTPLKSAVVNIEPVQDLHGYSYPWPAGGGVNKLDLSVCTLTDCVLVDASLGSVRCDMTNKYMARATLTKANFPSGLEERILNGDPISFLADNNVGYGIAIVINGTRSDSTTFQEFTASDWGVTAIPTLFSAVTSIQFRFRRQGTAYTDTTTVVTGLRLTYGSTDVAFSPYSNICPISGWAQVDIVAAGGNLLDQDDTTYISGEFQAYASNDTKLRGQLNALKSGTYTLSYSGEIISLNGHPSNPNTKFGLFFSASGNGASLSVNAQADALSPQAGSKYTKTVTFTIPDALVGKFTAAYVYSAKYGTGPDIYTGKFDWIQLNPGSMALPYQEYEVTPITIPLGQTVYGGTLDVVKGKLNAKPYYASYSGQTLVGPWISSHDKYVAGATPTTGAQVVDMGAAGTEYDVTPQTIKTLLGVNNIWANTGETEVEYTVPTENPTQWPSQPRLEITMSGAGTLTVNGKTWSIGSYTGTLICDSEIMDWYDAGALKNSLVSGDGFPELVPGDNVITYTGGITKVVATPRWRTL